jgi:hypothetical protein
MKLSFRFLIGILGLLGFTLLGAGCSEHNDINKFAEIGNAFAKNINQLNKEPGITQTGISSDPDKKLFTVGIAIDPNEITTEHLKHVLESYLNNVASFAHEQEYKTMLKPYNLHIEELVDKGNVSLIAEKSSGSSEINWKKK